MQCLALDQPQNPPFWFPAVLMVMSRWKKVQMKEAVEKMVIKCMYVCKDGVTALAVC